LEPSENRSNLITWTIGSGIESMEVSEE